MAEMDRRTLAEKMGNSLGWKIHGSNNKNGWRSR